jgi:hypothetical protein
MKKYSNDILFQVKRNFKNEKFALDILFKNVLNNLKKADNHIYKKFINIIALMSVDYDEQFIKNVLRIAHLNNLNSFSDRKVKNYD